MKSGQDLSRLYREVAENVSQALVDLSAVELASNQAGTHLESVRSRLAEIQERFDRQVDYLDEHAEWEKFTIAFFGETNAGKSTVVESLRIIFDERRRQEKIKGGRATLADLQETFAHDTERLLTELGAVYEAFGTEAATVRGEIGALAAMAAQEKADALRAAHRRTRIWVVLAALAGATVGAAAAWHVAL